MKRSTLIIIAITSLITFTVGYALFNSVANKPTTNLPDTGQREAELGGPKSVSLTNVAALSDILLANQMIAVRTQMSTFLLDYLDPNTTSARVIDTPTINQDGSITFSVEAKAPAGKAYSFERFEPASEFATGKIVTGTSKATTRLTVVLNRDSYTSITMTVKEYNYTSVEPLTSE